MEADHIKKELIQIVGNKNVITNRTKRASYRYGNVLEYRLSKPEFLSDYIIKVMSTAQVSSVLKLANKYKIPVVPWGGGTDFSGANSPIRGGLVIDLKSLNKIRINKEEMYATAGAGSILLQISKEAEQQGLLFPHEITSQPSATIGGAVSTNSFGLRSGKYRSIKNLILGIEAVLPTGEIVKTKPLFKTSTGYDIISLMTGSEGTLGIITEIVLRLTPLPDVRKISSYLFWSFDEAFEFSNMVYKILEPDIFNLIELCFITDIELKSEYLQNLIITQTNKDLDLAVKKGSVPAILTVGFEGNKKIVSEKEKILQELAKDAIPLKEMNFYNRRFARYHEDFRDILELHPEMSLDEMTYSSLDFSLPVNKVLSFNKNVIKIISEFPEFFLLDFDIYSHPSVIGMDILFPKEGVKSYYELLTKIYDQVLKEGGSLSSVHGIGTRLLSKLKYDIGEENIKFMEKIKDSLDPNKILNPGKIGNFYGRFND